MVQGKGYPFTPEVTTLIISKMTQSIILQLNNTSIINMKNSIIQINNNISTKVIIANLSTDFNLPMSTIQSLVKNKTSAMNILDLMRG